MSEWTLRRADEADARALALIAGATFLETFADVIPGVDLVEHIADKCSAERFAAWARDKGSIVTLAEAFDAVPVGYSVVVAPDLPIELRAGDFELRRIYALSRFHGAGIGQALIERACTDTRALGGLRMLIGVYGHNLRARAFYERNGFELAGTRRFNVGRGVYDDVIYARALT